MIKKHAKSLLFITILLVMTNIVFAYHLLKAKNVIDYFSVQATALENHEKIVGTYESKIAEYTAEIENYRKELEEYSVSLKEKEKRLEKVLEEKREAEHIVSIMTPAYNRWNLFEDRYVKTSRSDISRQPPVTDSSVLKHMRVTAYTEYECNKEPDHHEFGITASGNRVREWFTVAAGKEIPFGTRIYIPYFRDEVNNGIFVVEDRGGAIKENCIDVYIPDQDTVDNFGCKWLDVYILKD